MKVEPGSLLISYPFLEDDYFYRSVICMIEHNGEGSFGLIINKKMPYKIGELVPILSHLDNHIYMGGPVDTQSLFFLHPYPDLKDTMKVAEGLYMNGDIQELKDMIELDFAQGQEIRFYLGYSGWSVNQLQGEIDEKSWLIGPSNPGLVYDDSLDDIIWRKAVEQLGDEYKDLAKFPIDPQMN
ncbi:MAG: YqgE/AlgH family protein [Chitinophagales bacterium]|nr:YqgE/AlgH family protein [Chitinophagales bacterium]